MATGQSLLNLMEILFPEIQLQTGEGDVTKGLLCLNAAQDLYETLLAQQPNVMGSSTGTVTTTINTETTAFPAGCMRIDKLQYIDPTTSLPAWPLTPIQSVGDHRLRSYWPLNLIATTGTGKPRAFFTNGLNIYWDPLPDGTSTVRWYGFSSAADITASGTFVYTDAAMLPVATVAVRIFRTGLDDDPTPYLQVATETFTPLIATLQGFDRTNAQGCQYDYRHDT